MIEILNLRKTKDGYLANGYIPLLPNDEQVLKWIAEGNEVMPMFTDAEIEAQILAENINEAKNFLDKTDKKVLPFYDFAEDDNTLEWYVAERAKNRAFIRANDVHIS